MSSDRTRSHSPSRSKHKLRTLSKSSKERETKHRRHKKSKRSRSRSRDRLKDRSRSRSHSSSNSRSRSREYSKYKKKKKYKHKKSKKRKRSHSRSPSSSLSSYSSYSDDTDYISDSDISTSSYSSYSSSTSSNNGSYKKHKKKKSKKKKHRDKKHKKSKKKKSKKKKHKKKRKKKKHKKRDKKDVFLLDGNEIIYKPNEYREGEHGFITFNDIYNKMPEFTSWLIDIHGVCIDNLVKREEKKWFAKFCDDWNTSTMINDKYYNLDKWNKQQNGYNSDNDPSKPIMFGMSDEAKLNEEKRRTRQQEQDKRYTARVQEMKRHLIDLKSNNKKEWKNINDQYIPKKETFQSLAAKRRQKKVEDQVKRFGKYGANFTLD